MDDQRIDTSGTPAADAAGAQPFHRLPGRAPERIWGGRGTGAPCSLCQQRIGPDEVEFELEFEAGLPLREPYRVHSRCFAAWETFLRHAGRARGREDRRAG